MTEKEIDEWVRFQLNDVKNGLFSEKGRSFKAKTEMQIEELVGAKWIIEKLMNDKSKETQRIIETIVLKREGKICLHSQVDILSGSYKMMCKECGEIIM